MDSEEPPERSAESLPDDRRATESLDSTVSDTASVQTVIPAPTKAPPSEGATTASSSSPSRQEIPETGQVDGRGLSLQVSVSSTDSDQVVAELRRILERFFRLRGYELDPNTPVEVSTVIPASAYSQQSEDHQDVIDLHPSVEDEVEADDDADESFDIASSVSTFEKKRKFH